MKFIKASLIIACLGVSSVAVANEMYFGGGFAAIKYNEKMLNESASLNAAVVKFGTKFNDNFAAEARVGFGVGDDTVNVFGTDAKIKLNHFYGAYVKGGIAATEMFYPYAVLGYTRGELKASVAGQSATETESDFSYGVGMDFNFTGFTLNLEYQNYFDKNTAKVDGISIGFTKSF
jgi:outer membrane immunogenic protein